MVMSDVGGFRELVSEHGAGRLVPPGDRDALAAAISELLADTGARRELERQAAAAAAGPYSWERIAAATQRVYDEVLA
jgi:D-inositol-3-phosphate glycosyltransferase